MQELIISLNSQKNTDAIASILNLGATNSTKSDYSQASVSNGDPQTGKRTRYENDTDMSQGSTHTTTHNRFEILGIDNSTRKRKAAKQTSRNERNNTSATHAKVPPIIVTCKKQNITSIKLICNNAKYIYETISIGIKIKTSDKAEHEACTNTLKIHNIEFYTHELRDKKIFKVVLYGLPKIECAEIENQLNEYGIKPSAITELKTRVSNEHSTLYIIHFDKSNITLGQLKNIKSLSQVVVAWKPFKPKYKGPTQCLNCGMYGHGARNCNRTHKCLQCGEINHSTENCTLNNIKDAGSFFKCINCMEKGNRHINHRTNDPKCPCQKEFIEIRQKANQKQSNKPHAKTGFIMNEKHFPKINKSTHIQETRPPPRVSYVEATKNQNQSENLFSIDELFEIFMDAYEELNSCQTKAQQMHTIMKLLKNAIQ